MASLFTILLAYGANASGSTEPVLPPGLEQPVLDLLGPYGKKEPLASGWTLGDTRIDPKRITYEFHRGEDFIRLVLEYPSEQHAVRTRHFGLKLHDPGGVLSPKESRKLLDHLGALIRENDAEWEPWISLQLPSSPRGSIMWGPPQEEQFDSKLPIRPTTLCQLLLMLTLVTLMARFRTILRLTRKVPNSDWLWLGGAIAVGLVLRLLGGVRIPGFINGHGFDLVHNILYNPPQEYNFHLNGIYALHGLFLAVLPRCESTLVAIQLTLSLLTIPAIYALCRLWLGQRGPARWAALVAAILPVFVFYATTEVRPVAGAFCLVATLLILGVAVRDPHPILLLSAAFLGAFTVQIQPFLLLTPLVALLLVLSTPGGRRLLSIKWTWVASGVFLLLWMEPAIMGLTHLSSGLGPAGLVLPSLSAAHLAFLPGGGGEYAHPPGNVLLHPFFTPPPIFILVIAGLISAFRRPDGRLLTLTASLIIGLLFTTLGLIEARMNLARLQFFAQPFYCLLAGCGLAWVLQGIRGDWKWLPWLSGSASLAVLCLSLAIWPGPIGSVFTPQMERRVIQAGLGRLEDGQVVIWYAKLEGSLVELPTYLSKERGRGLLWRGLLTPRIPEILHGEELIYYRSATCYDLEKHIGEPVETQADGRLRRECARLESRLELQPIYVRSIPARPDCNQEFSQEKLRVGFFRVLSMQAENGW